MIRPPPRARPSTTSPAGCWSASPTTSSGAAVYFQEGPYITEWFTEEQVGYIRKAEATVYEHVRDVIDRGIASGEFYDCDSHVLALGYIGMTLGAYRWLRPHGRRTAPEIAVEFSTALLRGLIRDESVRSEDTLGGGND